MVVCRGDEREKDLLFSVLLQSSPHNIIITIILLNRCSQAYEDFITAILISKIFLFYISRSDVMSSCGFRCCSLPRVDLAIASTSRYHICDVNSIHSLPDCLSLVISHCTEIKLCFRAFYQFCT